MAQVNYQLLHELLPLLEEYQTQASDAEQSVMGFSVWLNQKLGYFSTHSLNVPFEGAEFLPNGGAADDPTVLTMLLTYLYRYAKHYTKKALENSSLSTLDEFGFLIALLQRDSLTKTELINLNLLEITSGIEIIKRLTKQGLLEVFPDPHDRRSRRVKLTDEGRTVLFAVIPRLQEVAHLVAADLSEAEKRFLLPILNRLNEFHAVIHHQDRRSELAEIAEKYL